MRLWWWDCERCGWFGYFGLLVCLRVSGLALSLFLCVAGGLFCGGFGGVAILSLVVWLAPVITACLLCFALVAFVVCGC